VLVTVVVSSNVISEQNITKAYVHNVERFRSGRPFFLSHQVQARFGAAFARALATRHGFLHQVLEGLRYNEVVGLQISVVECGLHHAILRWVHKDQGAGEMLPKVAGGFKCITARPQGWPLNESAAHLLDIIILSH